MELRNLLSVAAIAVAVSFYSCGAMAQSNSKSSKSSTSSVISSLAGSLLGGNSKSESSSSTTTSSSSSSSSSIISLAGSLLGGSSKSESSSSSLSSSSLISGVVGLLTNSTSSKSIVGTWVYSEPSVQFESENLLAQAGGVVAGQTVVDKLSPYYEKIGIKEGSFTFTFNSDKTCTFTIKGKEYSGTYEYDSSESTLVISTSVGVLNLPTAYVSATSSTLAMTYDASKILNIVTMLGSKSSNTTVSSISTLAESYDGMKVGFLMKKN